MENLGLYFIIVLVSIIVILNVVASYVLFNTQFDTKERRQFQLIFVWVIPVIGAMMVIYINKEDIIFEKRKKQIGNNTSISNKESISHGLGANDHGDR